MMHELWFMHLLCPVLITVIPSSLACLPAKSLQMLQYIQNSVTLTSPHPQSASLYQILNQSLHNLAPFVSQ